MAHLHKMIDKNIDKSSSDISLERQKNMPYSHKENNDIIQNLNIYQDKSLPCEKYNDEYTLVRTMDASNGSIKNGNSYDKLYEDVYMIRSLNADMDEETKKKMITYKNNYINEEGEQIYKKCSLERYNNLHNTECIDQQNVKVHEVEYSDDNEKNENDIIREYHLVKDNIKNNLMFLKNQSEFLRNKNEEFEELNDTKKNTKINEKFCAQNFLSLIQTFKNNIRKEKVLNSGNENMINLNENFLDDNRDLENELKMKAEKCIDDEKGGIYDHNNDNMVKGKGSNAKGRRRKRKKNMNECNDNINKQSKICEEEKVDFTKNYNINEQNIILNEKYNDNSFNYDINRNNKSNTNIYNYNTNDFKNIKNEEQNINNNILSKKRKTVSFSNMNIDTNNQISNTYENNISFNKNVENDKVINIYQTKISHNQEEMDKTNNQQMKRRCYTRNNSTNVSEYISKEVLYNFIKNMSKVAVNPKQLDSSCNEMYEAKEINEFPKGNK